MKNKYLVAISVAFCLCASVFAENAIFFVIVPDKESGEKLLALSKFKTNKQNEFILMPPSQSKSNNDMDIFEADSAITSILNQQNDTDDPAYQKLFYDATSGSAVYQANNFKETNTVYISLAEMQKLVQKGAETNFILSGKTYKINKLLLAQWGELEPKLLEKLREESQGTPGIPPLTKSAAIDKFGQALFRLVHEG